MNDKDIVQEWVLFAEMDLNTAKHLNKTMFPQPLAIICYHCQQAVEKYLKGALILFGVEIRKTHDLGILAEELNNYISVDDKYIDYCYDLTTYGVKTRYPQELQIEVYHKDLALKEAEEVCNWLSNIINKHLTTNK